MFKREKQFKFFVCIVLIVFLGVPTFNVVKTKKIEKVNKNYNKKVNYRNDASYLNETKVKKIIDVESDSQNIKKQLKGLLLYAKENNLKVSISGAKHTMGGHTIYQDGLSLNMLPYNRMHFDKKENILTIGSGATWLQALDYLDQFDKSVAIMQSFSDFTIGGSISVNAHGWQKGVAPISASVESFTLMNSQGEIINCSRNENSELFKLVIGGYGLFGIILDIRLHVIDNSALKFNYVEVKPSQFNEIYRKLISENPNVQLAYGRLRISDKNFLETASLNYFEKVETPIHPIDQKYSQNVELKRLVFRGSVNNEYGKILRWDLERQLNRAYTYRTFSRNEILSEDASVIENKDSTSTDILHEYFVPKDRLGSFINEINPILKKTNLDLLNITIREVLRDDDAFMNYAREDVFGLVFLFNQKKNRESEEEMINLTNQLVNAVLKNNGTFYLPYRLHISPSKFRIAYPQSSIFFELKKKYDPNEIFNNKFYQKYSNIGFID